MKKIQLYVDPDKEKEVYNLIEQIEEEGSDGFEWVTTKEGNKIKKRKLKRGYTQDRLKEMLRVYHILSNKYGTIEPYELLDKVLSNQVPTPTHVKEEIKEEVVNAKVQKLANMKKDW